MRLRITCVFEGMTLQAVPFDVLLATKAEIHESLPAALTDEQRRFLLSLVRLEPDWSLMPYAHLKELPAIQWKMLNLAKLKKTRPHQFEEQYRVLNDRFNAI